MASKSGKGEISFSRMKQLARERPEEYRLKLFDELGRSIGALNRFQWVLEQRLGSPEMLVWSQIAEKQALLPRWVLINADISMGRTRQGAWVYSIALFRKIVLQDGMFWERDERGVKRLCQIHPETGEKWIVIHYDVPDEDRVEIFRAEVDLAAMQVTLLKETTLADLDPNDYELAFEVTSG